MVVIWKPNLIHPHNPYFVGRQFELERFAQLLDTQEPLTILNVCGHSGVGKSWLMEEFLHLCDEARMPYAHLSPRELDSEPLSLLTVFARRIGLEKEGLAQTYDERVISFATALHALDAPVAVLMLDDYDQMRRWDHQVRRLIGHLMRVGPFDGQALRLTHEGNSPRFIVVIGSQLPLREYWPVNPVYLRALRELSLRDFTFQETASYLTRVDVPSSRHQTFFRATHGYPLALALATTLGNSVHLAPLETGERIEQQQVLSPGGRQRLVREILERDLRALGDSPMRSEILNVLHASAVVRHFDRPLLAELLDLPDIPDELFNRLTALSMVVARERIGGPQTFALHDALRMALLADARDKGLEALLLRYRQRALAWYQSQLAGGKEGEATDELAMDVLFLHQNPAIQDVFFGATSTLVSAAPVSFTEMEEALAPLMRQNPLYHDIGLEGDPLERLIHETGKWLALDWRLHGESLRYVHGVRRVRQQGEASDIAGFALVVPLTADTLPLLRRDPVSRMYEAHVGPLEDYLESLADREQRLVFLLRLVVRGWDCLSALMRAFFIRLDEREADVIVAITPWPLLGMLAEALGFRLVADGIEREGRRHAIWQLDMSQYASPLDWLMELVRSDLNPPCLDDWLAFVGQVRQALEELWEGVTVLGQNPLIETLGLADPLDSTPARAVKLRQAIGQAHARLCVSEAEESALVKQGKVSHYRLLNELYGIVGVPRRRFRGSAGRPPQYVVAELLEMGHPQPFSRQRDAAIEALAEELWRTRFGAG